MPVVLRAVPNVSRFRELRTRRFRTQGSCAAAIGKHRNWVWAIENYDTVGRLPSFATMCDLAEVFEVDVGEIVEEIIEPIAA
jgi:transcriptional regulator with XRE-family HTH domain